MSGTSDSDSSMAASTGNSGGSGDGGAAASTTGDTGGAGNTTAGGSDTATSSPGDSGATTTGGNGGDGGTTTEGTGGTGGATTKGTGGTGGTPDCDELLRAHDSALTAAQTCLVGGIVPECLDVVDGLCCPQVIASESSEAGRAYLAALKAVLDANCLVVCPAVLCVEPTGGNCAGEHGDTGGVCRPAPGPGPRAANP
jgi:hypothetical protein